MPNIFIDDLVIKLPSEVHNVINPRFAFNSLLCTNKNEGMRNNSLITIRELQGGAILMPFDEHGNIAVTPNHKYTLVEIETNVERPLRTSGNELVGDHVSAKSSSPSNVIKNNTSKINSANNTNTNDNTAGEKIDKMSSVNLAASYTHVKGKRQRNGEGINTTHQKQHKDHPLQDESSKQVSKKSVIDDKDNNNNSKLIANSNNECQHQLQKQNERKLPHENSKDKEILQKSNQKWQQKEMTATKQWSNQEEAIQHYSKHKKGVEDKDNNIHANVKQAKQKLDEFSSKRSTYNNVTTEKEEESNKEKLTQSKKKSYQAVSNHSLSSSDDAPLTTLFSTSKSSSPELHEPNENVLERAKEGGKNSSKSTVQTKAKELSSLELESGKNELHLNNVNAHNKGKNMHTLASPNNTEHEEQELDHQLGQNAETANSANLQNVIDTSQERNSDDVKSSSESKDAKSSKKKNKTDESPLLELFADATHEHSILDKRSSNSISSSNTQLSAAASPNVKRTKSSSPEKKRRVNNISSLHSPDAAAALTEANKSNIDETKLHRNGMQMPTRKQTLNNFDVSSDSEERLEDT